MNRQRYHCTTESKVAIHPPFYHIVNRDGKASIGSINCNCAQCFLCLLETAHNSTKANLPKTNNSHCNLENGGIPENSQILESKNKGSISVMNNKIANMMNIPSTSATITPRTCLVRTVKNVAKHCLSSRCQDIKNGDCGCDNGDCQCDWARELNRICPSREPALLAPGYMTKPVGRINGFRKLASKIGFFESETIGRRSRSAGRRQALSRYEDDRSPRSHSASRHPFMCTPLLHGPDAECAAQEELAYNNHVIVRDVLETAWIPDPNSNKHSNRYGLSARPKSIGRDSRSTTRDTDSRLHSEAIHPVPISNKNDDEEDIDPVLQVVETSFNCDKPITGQPYNKPSVHKTVSEDRYNAMAQSHVTTLAFMSEHFHEMTREHAGWQLDETAWKCVRWHHLHMQSTSAELCQNVTFQTAQLDVSKFPLADGEPSQKIFQVSVMISHSLPTSLIITSAHTRLPFLLPILWQFECVDSPWSDGTPIKIAVMPRYHIRSIDQYANTTSSQHHVLHQPSSHEKNICFLGIQLLTALKHLQSRGLEELSTDMNEFIIMTPEIDLLTVSHDSADNHRLFNQSVSQPNNPSTSPRLCLVPEVMSDDEYANQSANRSLSLCQYAVHALSKLLHVAYTGYPEFRQKSVYSIWLQNAAEILSQERTQSLTNALVILQCAYWIISPSQQLNSAPPRLDEDQWCKTWIDMERAKLVTKMVRLLVESDRQCLDIGQRYQISFLLHVTVKQLQDCSRIARSRKPSQAK